MLRPRDILYSIVNDCVHVHVCISVEIGSSCAKGFKGYLCGGESAHLCLSDPGVLLTAYPRGAPSTEQGCKYLGNTCMCHCGLLDMHAGWVLPHCLKNMGAGR